MALFHQPALVCLGGELPERRLLAGQQQVRQLQLTVAAPLVDDEAAPGQAVGTAGVLVTGQFDDDQPAMLLAHLRLQVAGLLGLGAAQVAVLVRAQRGRQGIAGMQPGHFQQAPLDQPVQHRLVGEMQGVDIDQRAGLSLAAGRALFPGLSFIGRLIAERQQLAGTQEGETGEQKTLEHGQIP